MKPRKIYVLTAILGVSIAAITTSLFRSDIADTRIATVTKQELNSQEKRAFPWELSSGESFPAAQDPGSEEITSENATDEEIGVASSLAGMTKPPKPVNEIVSTYQDKKNPANADKEELIAALSYCANRQSVGEIARSQSAQGASPDASSFMTIYADYLKYCGTLDSSAYTLRKDILGQLAENGNPEARLMYFEVGPIGRWPESNEYIPLTNKEIEIWNQTAISYLEQSIRDGNVQAYKTLAAMHAANSDDPILGSLRNESQSYAYDSLWAASLLSNPDIRTEVKASVVNYMSQIESRLTQAKKKEGKLQAQQILSRLKK